MLGSVDFIDLVRWRRDPSRVVCTVTIRLQPVVRFRHEPQHTAHDSLSHSLRSFKLHTRGEHCNLHVKCLISGIRLHILSTPPPTRNVLSRTIHRTPLHERFFRSDSKSKNNGFGARACHGTVRERKGKARFQGWCRRRRPPCRAKEDVSQAQKSATMNWRPCPCSSISRFSKPSLAYRSYCFFTQLFPRLCALLRFDSEPAGPNTLLFAAVRP